MALGVVFSQRLGTATFVAGLLLGAHQTARAQNSPATSERGADLLRIAEDRLALHGQVTLVWQGHGRFRSPYQGPNSLAPSTQARETLDATLYLGTRTWSGAEVWINPEIDQGFGLSDTLGVAGFPSGEAYKVGRAYPYLRLQRAFVRQTIDLGGARQTLDAGLNQFSGSRSADRVVVTFGKFSVGDVFDTNAYAHDPRADFLNWTIIDAGSFDYAADAWGYSAGTAVEWYQGAWAARLGAFVLSDVPNSTQLDTRFEQFQLVGELEERHTLGARPGKLRLTGYLSRARMAKLDDASALAVATGQPADAALVRRYAGRPGASVNLEQEVTGDLGVFARAGWADGRYEAYEFTDVDRSVSAGLSLSGARFGRAGDRVGLAGVVNMPSAARERFLNAGGLGILVGDGRLPHPGAEWIVESYYDWAVRAGVHLAFDYQHVTHPAYNRDRGPVDVVGLRLHAEY